ncbi:unnamed protein product [Phytophthora lilii]|uniref:Unnamed protein product n=1 Tax=Phytophthora lilii TaxID=2077276 RepID=A0A9W6TPB7_9STRA|nr:unnamed protein product [Phytophthora lilii]
MKITFTTQLATALAVTVILTSEADASKKFVRMIPNGENVPDTPAIGHPDGTGKSAATNAFGDSFAAAGNKWTKELCKADTDGDGQTNGQELGDPCCEWDKDTNPVVLWTTGVSHPDDATKTSDPSLWAGKCGSATASTSSEETSAPTASSTETMGASSGSTATRAPTTNSGSSSVSSSSATASSASKSSATSESSSQSDGSQDSSMQMHMHSSDNSSSSEASMSASGSNYSIVEVGSPSASSGDSQDSIRTASSSSTDKIQSSSSSSSSAPTTNSASAKSPVFITMAAVVSVALAFIA